MNNLAWRVLNRAKLLDEEQHFRKTGLGGILAAKYPELDFLQFDFNPTIDEIVLYLLFIYQFLKTDGPKE